MATTYRSFEEIDQRLKILSLQRQIHKESLKLHLSQTKSDLVPRRLVQSLNLNLGEGRTIKNLLMAFFIKKALTVLQGFKKDKPLLE